MSTLTVSNIKATGETASRAVSGVAAAWCHFQSTSTPSILNSFNASGLTDNGTGNVAVNLTSSMSDSDFCANALFGQVGVNYLTASQNIARTSSAFTALAKNISGTNTDGDEQSYLIHGDLA